VHLKSANQRYEYGYRVQYLSLIPQKRQFRLAGREAAASFYLSNKSMKHLKIGQRLALGFGIVVALMVAVLATGISALSGMRDTIDTIVNDNNMKIEAVTDLRDAERQLAIAVRDLTLVTDEQAMQQADGRMAAASDKYAQAMAVLQERVRSPQGRALLDKVVAAEAVAVRSSNSCAAMAGTMSWKPA